jgi:hypothetical protein
MWLREMTHNMACLGFVNAAGRRIYGSRLEEAPFDRQAATSGRRVIEPVNLGAVELSGLFKFVLHPLGRAASVPPGEARYGMEDFI